MGKTNIRFSTTDCDYNKYVTTKQEVLVWVKYLRVFCLIQVLLLHYFSGHSLNELVWLFRGAVPTFIIISAYLYGLKNYEQKRTFGGGFLKRRFIKLSVPYYLFLLAVFTYWCVVNPKQTGHYTMSLVSELLYLTDFGSIIEPLPNCGHLYFLQLIMMCYLLLFFLSKTNLIQGGAYLFRNIFFIFSFFLILLASGFVFRKLYLIVFFFYLLVYYNAKIIKKYADKVNLLALFAVIGVSYIAYFFIKQKDGTYPSFIFQIWGYFIAIFTLALFQKVFQKAPDARILSFFSSILMEFYLIHHLFVFDYPLYLSLPITLLLSFVLNRLSNYLQKCKIVN